MSPPGTSSLTQRSMAAALWGSFGAVARLLLQIGAQVLLARLLGPDQYGLFAIGATVISFSAFFSDIGLAYGLIQKSEVSDDDVRFVFTWQIVLGLAVSLAVLLAASPIAAFFAEPRAVPVVQALSVLCLLNALNAPSLNLLKRRLDFKTIQLTSLAAYFTGYVLVGVPLALAGRQVWALVVAWVVQAVVTGLLMYRAVRHPCRPLWWYRDAGSQSRYGGTVLVTNLVNWLIGNIDRVIVGRFFGSRDIGLYATSYNLFYNPAATLLGVIQPVFFSASARIQDDPARIVSAYRALLALMATFVLPAFVCVSVIAETFVLTLYGRAWLPAAEVCRPIALVMPVFLLFGLTTPLLWTAGRASREFLVQLPVALLWLGASLLAAQHSMPAVAWTVLGLYALRAGVVVRAACRAMSLPASALWAASRGGLLLTACLGLAIAAVDHAMPRWSAAPWTWLLADVAAAAACWLLCVRLLPGWVAPELRALIGRMLERLPQRLARHLAFLAPLRDGR